LVPFLICPKERLVVTRPSIGLSRTLIVSRPSLICSPEMVVRMIAKGFTALAIAGELAESFRREVCV
jgi:hypothetical protein